MREKRLAGQKTPVFSDTNEEKIAFLAHSDLFCHLHPDEISELERMTTTITCLPGQVLYRPGETSTALFLVKTGCVQLYHLSTDGRKLISATVEAGHCFGEIALIGQRVHTSFAEAATDAVVYAINKYDIEQCFIHKPTFASALLQLLAERYSQLETQLIDTAFKSTSARLAVLLLQLAHMGDSSEKQLVVNGLSHEELADRLGVYRETVSSALRELKDAGAIELGRKHITISAPQRLKDLASSIKRSYTI